MEQDFAEQLAALYAALADADAADVPAQRAVDAAEAVAASFARADGSERARYLLRALDDAIAALEVATRLADEFHGTANPTAPPDTSDPLYAPYAEFVEGQATFQALYHCRNALAARVTGGDVPSAAPAAPAPTDAQPPMAEETGPPG